MSMQIEVTRLPLTIVGYHLEKTDIRINPPELNGEGVQEITMPAAYRLDMTIAPQEGMPKHWSCSLSVRSTRNDDDKPLTLEFDVAACGIFKNDVAGPETGSDVLKLQTFAYATLLACIREHIASVTANSPAGSHYIPPMAFYVGEDDQHEKNTRVASGKK